MNLSERNRKVANIRWEKVHNNERKCILNNEESFILKSAICGFLAGDGSVQKRKERSYYHYQVDLFADDIQMVDVYLKAINKVYNKNPSVVIRDNCYHVRLGSRVIVEDLFSISEFGLTKWRLPSFIFSLDGAEEAWLKAFFSAEAYVGKDHIKIQTINQKGMLEVSELLISLGIENKVYYYTPKNENYSMVTIIRINKKSDLKIYSEKVGFWHNKKNIALKKALDL